MGDRKQTLFPAKINETVGARKFELEAVSKMLDIPNRHVSYLVEQGIVSPSYGASGKGTKRRFGVRNLVELALCYAVTGLGAKASVSCKILNVLRGVGYFARLAEPNRDKECQYVVVTNKEQVAAANSLHQVSIALHDGAGIVIELDTIERMVADAVCG